MCVTIIHENINPIHPLWAPGEQEVTSGEEEDRGSEEERVLEERARQEEVKLMEISVFHACDLTKKFVSNFMKLSL